LAQYLIISVVKSERVSVIQHLKISYKFIKLQSITKDFIKTVDYTAR